jgi:hypothetical protein
MNVPFRRRRPDAPTVYVGDHTDKLSRIPSHPHDPDERPSREDRRPLTPEPFRIPVPLPRFLHPRRERRGR